MTLLDQATGGGSLKESANSDVYQRIADLARKLHSSPCEDADSVLVGMVQHAVREVPGAKYAGVTLVNAPSALETPATTHPYPTLLDAIQQNHREGPCLSAAWHQHTIRIDNLAVDDRWPRYRRDALRTTPIRSVLSFRLFTSDKTLGALNLFADHPRAFTEDAEEIGYILATHTALAWDTARRERDFSSALASRDIIGQAKGILMGRFNIDATQAFDLLTRVSQSSNTRLVEVARKLVSRGNYDDLTERPFPAG